VARYKNTFISGRSSDRRGIATTPSLEMRRAFMLPAHDHLHEKHHSFLIV
jgi:hypothetical protein